MHPRTQLAAMLVLLCAAVATCAGGRESTASSPTSPSPTAPAAPQSPAGWTLVFSDEFDTPGALDASKWGYETGYIRNQEAQYYTSRPENVRAEGGMLVIEARKEAYQSFGYTSASINTLGKFEFLYGPAEVRAKLPTGNGTWPAIWMQGTNHRQVVWPACGEIDIMENVGFDPHRISAAIHTTAYNHTKGTQKSAKNDVASPWEDFHIYAMEFGMGCDIAQGYLYARPMPQVDFVQWLADYTVATSTGPAASTVPGRGPRLRGPDDRRGDARAHPRREDGRAAVGLRAGRCWLGGAGAASLAALGRYAAAIGLAFQVVDALLDATESSATLGKTAGKDRHTDKATYVKLYGVEATRSKARALLAQALEALAPLAGRAAVLAELARRMVERHA